jgi:hypothetical protein
MNVALRPTSGLVSTFQGAEGCDATPLEHPKGWTPNGENRSRTFARLGAKPLALV